MGPSGGLGALFLGATLLKHGRQVRAGSASLGGARARRDALHAMRWGLGPRHRSRIAQSISIGWSGAREAPRARRKAFSAAVPPKDSAARGDSGALLRSCGRHLTRPRRVPPSQGKPHDVYFRLTPDCAELVWTKTTSAREKPRCLPLALVDCVVAGQETPVFGRHPDPATAHLSFSLVYTKGGARRSLDMVCSDEVQYRLWFTSLKQLTQAYALSAALAQGQRQPTGGTTANAQPAGSGSGESSDVSLRASSSSESLEQGDADGATAESARGGMPFGTASSGPASSDSDHEPVVQRPRRRGGGGGGSGSVSMSPLDTLCDVYVWGGGGLVQGDPRAPAGQADVRWQCSPRPLPDCCAMDGLSGVAVGSRHAAVAVDGALYAWGDAGEGRLGTRTAESSPVPQQVSLGEGRRARAVGCGAFFTAAVSEDGELYTWGAGLGTGVLSQSCGAASTPSLARSPHLMGERVRGVSCGPFTMAVLTESGGLLMCGEGTFGALGDGTRNTAVQLQPVAGPLALVSVVHVRCGAWHTAAITVGGDVYTWGANEKGQLGQGKKGGVQPVPAKADLGNPLGGPKSLACGAQYTMVATKAGQLLSCGASATLGREGDSTRFLPVDVGGGQPVTHLSGNACHVACVASGELYTWGLGKGGRLGHGDERDYKTPTLVEALQDTPVLRAVCGEEATAAVVANAAGARFKVSGAKAKGRTFEATVNAIKAISALQSVAPAHEASSRRSDARRQRRHSTTVAVHGRARAQSADDFGQPSRRPPRRRMSSAEFTAAALATMRGKMVPSMEARHVRQRSWESGAAYLGMDRDLYLRAMGAVAAQGSRSKRWLRAAAQVLPRNILDRTLLPGTLLGDREGGRAGGEAGAAAPGERPAATVVDVPSAATAAKPERRTTSAPSSFEPSPTPSESASERERVLLAEVRALRQRCRDEARRADVASRRAAEMATQLVQMRSKRAGVRRSPPDGRAMHTPPSGASDGAPSANGHSSEGGSSEGTVPSTPPPNIAMSSSSASGFTGGSAANAAVAGRHVGRMGGGYAGPLASPASVGSVPFSPRRPRTGIGRSSKRTVEAAPGVHVTMVTGAQGRTQLQNVRFSRKHFAGEAQAEEWWSRNKASLLRRLANGSCGHDDE